MGIHYQGTFLGTPAKFATLIWDAARRVAAAQIPKDLPTAYCVFVEPEITITDRFSSAKVDEETMVVRVKFFSPRMLPLSSQPDGPVAAPDVEQAAAKAIDEAPETMTYPAGFITVSLIPFGKSSLQVECEDGAWPIVESTWQQLNAVIAPWLEAEASSPPESAPGFGSQQPWEAVPDNGWDRKVLQLWWEDYTVPEIAKKLNLADSTVRNRLSELRKNFKQDVVPTNEQRKRRPRKEE